MKKLLLLSLLSAPAFSMKPVKKVLDKIVISKPAQFKIVTGALIINSVGQSVKAIKESGKGK